MFASCNLALYSAIFPKWNRDKLTYKTSLDSDTIQLPLLRNDHIILLTGRGSSARRQTRDGINTTRIDFDGIASAVLGLKLDPSCLVF